jgi:hypothetical protein
MSRFQGHIFVSASLYGNFIGLAAEFGAPAVAMAFLISARSIIVKWLECRKDRFIEIKHHDTVVSIKGSNDIKKALEIFERLPSREDA